MSPYNPSSYNEPSLGVFWGASNAGAYIPLIFSKPFIEVPLIAGFRTLPEGHIDVWPTVRRPWPQLRSLEYDEVPRGRVNWREEDNLFLILLDKRLRTEAFIAALVANFNLLNRNTQVLLDAHYR